VAGCGREGFGKVGNIRRGGDITQDRQRWREVVMVAKILIE